MNANPAAQKQPNPHDSFFKRLFSHVQTAPEFLALALPEKDRLRLDLKRVRIEKDTFPGGKAADLLLSAPVRGALEDSLRLFVLAEHKAERLGPKIANVLRRIFLQKILWLSGSL